MTICRMLYKYHKYKVSHYISFTYSTESHNFVPMKRTYRNIFASTHAAPGNTRKARPLIVEVEAVGNKAHITISGGIYSWNENSAAEVARKISDLKAKGITDAIVYINSEGGSVFQANEINNLLEDNFETISIVVGALAASAATYLVAKHPASAKSNSLFMIHKPRGIFDGNEDEIVSQLEMLRLLTADYREVYASRFKITPEEVDELWAKGDYWMTAAKAKKMGLIQTILDGEAKIDEETALLISACGCPKPAKITEKPQKTEIKMELSALAASLGLPATATQQEVDAKLRDVQAKASRAEQLEAAAQASADAELKAVLDEGERTKKIAPTTRSFYEKMGKTDLAGLKAVLAEMPQPTAASEGMQTKPAGGEDRSKWTFADYQAKDPEAFIQLLDKEPAKAKALADAHYTEN